MARYQINRSGFSIGSVIDADASTHLFEGHYSESKSETR